MADEILNSWLLSTKDFPKLKFYESKQLYLQMQKALTEEEKLRIRNKIIEGTYYVINHFLITIKDSILNGGQYDMDDVINTSLEVWIEKIDSGQLLEVGFYSRIVSSTFYKNVIDRLISEKEEINIACGDNMSKFIDLLYDFINEGYSYSEFLEKFANKKDPSLGYIYYLITTIAEEIRKRDYKNMPKSRLALIVNFLVHNALETTKSDFNFINVEYENSMLNKMVENNLFSSLSDAIKNLSVKEQVILKKRFGLNNTKRLTLKEVGDEFNVSKENIWQLEARALQKLRKPEYSSKIRELL